MLQGCKLRAYRANGRWQARPPDGEPEPPKALYVYELDRTWRRRPGVARVEVAPAKAPHEGLSSDVWAETEFGGAWLKRCSIVARLVKRASMLADVVVGTIVAIRTMMRLR